jgi:hypothetical protein
MQNMATVMRQDDEEIQDSKLYGRNCEEVDRNHLANVISKENHPCMRWLLILPRHQSGDGSFGNVESEFQQFSVHTRRSPTMGSPQPLFEPTFEFPNGLLDGPDLSCATIAANTV